MRSLTSFIAVLLFLSPALVSASEHCQADFDGDGDVDAADLAELLASWGPCPECGDDAVNLPGESCDGADAGVLGCSASDSGLGSACRDDCSCCGDSLLQPGEECDPPDGENCGDNCQFIVPPDCCFPHGPAAGCEVTTCESAVCAVDSFCCTTEWDLFCVLEAAELCPVCFGIDCCFDHTGPGGIFAGCTDPVCESIVCGISPFCCNVAWDQLCGDFAAVFCEQCSF